MEYVNKFLFFWLVTTLSVVSSDLDLIDKDGIVVFQTATDFFKLPQCASFSGNQPGLLQVASPLYTCEDSVKSPISFLDSLYSNFISVVVNLADLLFDVNLRQLNSDLPWVLMTGMEDSGGCDLGKKLANIQNAGYSAVILATELSKVKLNKSLTLATEDVPSSLCVHLLNPFDLQILTKFNGQGSYRIRLHEESESLKGTSAPIPLLREKIKTWFEGWWVWLVTDNLVAVYFNGFLNSFFKAAKIGRPGKDFFATLISVAVLAGPWTYFILYLYWNKPKDSYHETPPPPPRYTKFHFEAEEDEEPPPPPPPSSRESRQLDDSLVLLGITRAELLTLTMDRLNRKYREVAHREHPDRFAQADERVRLEQTEKTQWINAARDFLLAKCVDANRSSSG